MSGENRVLGAESSVLANGFVGECLDVAFLVAPVPDEVGRDLTGALIFGDCLFEQLALLVVDRKASNHGSTDPLAHT